MTGTRKKCLSLLLEGWAVLAVLWLIWRLYLAPRLELAPFWGNEVVKAVGVVYAVVVLLGKPSVLLMRTAAFRTPVAGNLLGADVNSPTAIGFDVAVYLLLALALVLYLRGAFLVRKRGEDEMAENWEEMHLEGDDSEKD